MILNCFESQFYHNVTLEWLAHCMGKTKASITILCCPLAHGNTLFPDCAFFSVNLRSRSASEKLPFSFSSFGQRSGAYYKAQLGTRASYGSMSWCVPHWTRALVGTQELKPKSEIFEAGDPLISQRQKPDHSVEEHHGHFLISQRIQQLGSLILWRFYVIKALGGCLRIRIKYFIMILNLWVLIIHREPSHFLILEPLSMVQKQLLQGM